MKKKLINLLLVLMITFIPFNTAFAAHAEQSGVVGGGAGSPATGLYGIDPSFNGDLGEMNTPLQNVLGVIQVVGFVVAIVMVMYVGIKYLTAGAGQKAEVKSTMVPMLVGAAMVGLAPTLVKWIFEIFI